MPIFSKLKSGKLKEHMTIGEQKKYYEQQSNNPDLKDKERKYATKKLKELNSLTEDKKAVSKNFVAEDGLMTGNKNNPHKARYGVCTRVRNDGTLNVNPFMPAKEEEIKKGHQVKVKAQEGLKKEHAVRVRATTKINIDEICEDKGFPEAKTRKLTNEEFRDLKKKSSGNKKKRT